MSVTPYFTRVYGRKIILYFPRWLLYNNYNEIDYGVYIMPLRIQAGSAKQKEVFSTLAKLLASEDISVVHQKVRTASWTPSTRTLTLPIMKDMQDFTYSMYVGHEVGHVLYSPDNDDLGEAFKKYTKKYVNILEDCRVDKMIKKKFPGLKRDYYLAYEKFAKDKYPQELTPDMISKMSLVDRINVDDKSGNFHDVKFSDEEQVFVDRKNELDTFDDVIKLIEDIKAWEKKKKEEEEERKRQEEEKRKEEEAQEKSEEESEEQAEDDSEQENDNVECDDDDGLFDGQAEEEEKVEDADESEEESEEESEDETEEESEVNNSAEESEEADEEEGEESDETQESDTGYKSKEEESEEEESQSSQTSGQFDEDADDADESDESDEEDEFDTSEMFEDGMDNLVDEGAKERGYYNIPLVDSNPYIVDYKIVLKQMQIDYDKNASEFEQRGITDRLERFFNQSKKSVAHMAKEFEMKKRAESHKRAQTSRTGVIDTNRLFSYKTDDNIFKKVTTIPDGKNHGLVMFIDWSRSMIGSMEGTIKQMMNLVMFCRKVNIPFEVYSFTDGSILPDDPKNEKVDLGNFKEKDEIIVNPKLRLRNYFSSRMNEAEFKRAMLYMTRIAKYNAWSNCISKRDLLALTPLNSAIIVANDLIKKFQSKNNLQIVNTVFLTDGDSQAAFYKNSSEKEGIAVVMDYEKDIYVSDPITKKSTHARFGNNVTNILLQSLQDRLNGINIIGFFLSSQKNAFYLRNKFYSDLNIVEFEDKIIKQWKNDKFLIVKNAGYTEFFIINSNSLDERVDEFKVPEGATVGKIKNAFMKVNKASSYNKVILQRFIDLIA